MKEMELKPALKEKDSFKLKWKKIWWIGNGLKQELIAAKRAWNKRDLKEEIRIMSSIKNVFELCGNVLRHRNMNLTLKFRI